MYERRSRLTLPKDKSGLCLSILKRNRKVPGRSSLVSVSTWEPSGTSVYRCDLWWRSRVAESAQPSEGLETVSHMDRHPSVQSRHDQRVDMKAQVSSPGWQYFVTQWEKSALSANRTDCPPEVWDLQKEEHLITCKGVTPPANN